MKKINLFIVSFILQIGSVFPQNTENFHDDISSMEDLFVDAEKENNPEIIIEELNYLSENKININKTTEADLLRIPFLSERDAHEIINHRNKYGKIFSIYELKNIPGLGMQTIQQISPFITIETEPEFSLKQSLKYSKNQLFLRYDRFLQDKNGYINKATEPNKKYEGDPNYYYAKYLFRVSDKIDCGFVAEKDAGEQAWEGYNKGFDFCSFHFQLSNIDFLKRWVLGDYKVSFGQGLVVGTNSIIGKSANVLNIAQRNRGLQKYTSTGESGYFRGTGATVGFGGVDLSLFYSQRKIDANLSEDGYITSFKTDGLHRIQREIEKKQNVSEEIVGGNWNYWKQAFSIGGTFIKYSYNRLLQPAEKPYNIYKIQKDNNYWNAGVDYIFRFHGMCFFGELACGKKDGRAFLNGVNIYPTSRFGLSLLYRYYSPAYQANYANGFGENSHIENEQGIYLGAEFKPVKRIKVSAYVDTYYFPWVKYNLDKPSSGSDLLGYISFYPFRETTMYLKYKYKTKEKNSSESHSVVSYETHTARYGIQSKLNRRLASHSILDGNKYFDKSSKSSYGWLVAQDFSYDLIATVLNISTRYAYFHALAYENRLYIYEKDVLSAFSIPAYYGVGHRICLNLRFQPMSNLTCYFKYAAYIYTDGREVVGNGLEEVKGNKFSSVKFLVWYKI